MEGGRSQVQGGPFSLTSGAQPRRCGDDSGSFIVFGHTVLQCLAESLETTVGKS